MVLDNPGPSGLGQTGVGQTGVRTTGAGHIGVGMIGVGQTGVGMIGVGHMGVGQMGAGLLIWIQNTGPVFIFRFLSNISIPVVWMISTLPGGLSKRNP